ncbi:transcriptional regulator [Echinicola pacifica]|uniref:Transcriptional regulator n=1 Tax=Echinicola pacifica TaxID=346377 RepID=A0A918PQ45_9BACT|nr:GntR family transcriptional regulator [Echinicola pacifica]GGZ16545.1 transcriptional regulator [Echinicola pacifica]
MITEVDIFDGRINDNSSVPKYRQLSDLILQAIERKDIEVGEKLPSITEIRENTGLSRDTIVKALNFLRKKRVIASEMSKGFYVTRNVNLTKTKVMIILNKLSNYKLKIFNSFVDALGADYQVDVRVHHCNAPYLLEILTENQLVYDHFVVMPHFNDEQEIVDTAIDYFRKMPTGKLLLMDKHLPALEETVPCIYQDFKMDIYNALTSGAEKISMYKKIILVFPENHIYPYPTEIKDGFEMFCEDMNCNSEIIDKIYPDMEFEPGDAYIIIDEEDLINFLQQTRNTELSLGHDVGVISYNDTPLKKVLDISVLSTDFEVMADSVAYMLKKNKCETVQNYFDFIDRGSL